MADILTIENLGNLLMLCFLQAVLGFDNLLYISIESPRAPVASQKAVRFWGGAVLYPLIEIDPLAFEERFRQETVQDLLLEHPGIVSASTNGR